MKNFKDFKAEQQYTTEIIQYGPIGATLAAAAGIFGGYLAVKKGLEKFKGYRESKAEKKARERDGFDMTVKVYNPATGKEEDQDFYIDPKEGNADLEKLGYKLPRTASGRIKAPDDDQLDKMEKEAKKKSSMKTGEIKRKQAQGTLTDDDLTTDQQIQKKDADKEKTKKDLEKKGEKERAGIENVKDAEEYFKNKGEAPPGWRNAGTPEEPELMTRADYAKELKRRKRVGSIGTGKERAAAKKKPSSAGQGTTTGKDTSAADKLLQRNSKMLSFGEFISEDIMKDLKKVSKSKKDMEITLDDGSDIPIDPMTAEIFVKYIEGLKSSEQKRVINQIQRTERGFMKVLGKAHGE